MTNEQEVPLLASCSPPYGVERHQHLFAAWAASRAASVKGCRFKVLHGRQILESSGFTPALCQPDQLPAPEEMDSRHQEWRNSIIEAAKRCGLQFTHGVAAKLINVYLKSRFVCGGHHDHERVCHLHPPIDDELLKTLIRENVGGHRTEWRRARRWRWSKFTSDQYEQVIGLIRTCLNCQALWRIEEHWRGNQ